ncbi:uncharacterized protein LOC128221086 [Mya arenaria]|uniref:uncharacterized protein LOC128221086 n=1 Tax=Mya arenaria TaxID=6604 RepID=UPI0022E350DC|nr:uncharacterized protein LOC128221086 [Mya arenaria]
MRPVVLYLMLCLTVLVPIQGSRLGKLEDVVKSLRSFIYSELSSIRHEVKEISNRVDILENTTVTHDPSSSYQDIDITSNNLVNETRESVNQLLRDKTNEASHVVKAEIQNMRKAYSNDKKDLHILKQDVQYQLRELEQKITTHMYNLTADVQHNIEYIHENISLANIALSEFINGSTTNVSIFSDNIKMEIKEVFASKIEHFTLKFNETEAQMKINVSSTLRQNEAKLERFVTLADRNVSEIMLKSEKIFSFVRTNFSEMPIQITNLTFELQTNKNEIRDVEKRLWNILESTSSHLRKDIDFLKDLHYYYYPSTKDIRLANASSYGSNGVQGRLEVRHDNIWGTVCDYSFQNVGERYITNNVNVVCRMFGFQECDYVEKAGLGEGSGDILMDIVLCLGGESSILECSHAGRDVNFCHHSEDVGFRMWN